MVAALACVAQVVIVNNDSFRSVYDLETQCPQQVCWTIHREDLGESKRVPSWKFLQTIDDYRATAQHSDFSKSGFDRGHMCPAADRSYDLYAMRTTFDLSNVAAQAPRLNRGDWKRSEIFCRNAATLYGSVCVMACPVFLDRDTTHIGVHQVAVPHAFFKVAWLEATDSVVGIWFFFNR